MQIVIDINEKELEKVTDKDHFYTVDEAWEIIRAVQNGTPLPKGHGRIVDMNKALEVLAIEWGYEGIEDDLHYNVPTIIEADKEDAECK